MSDNIDLHALEYRTLVASIARQLTAEEIFEVAFIWLSKKEDVSKYSPSCKPRICGLEVFAKLECYGIYSRSKITGLVDIVKRVNRYDLVKKVEAFAKKKGSSYGTRYKKKDASSTSEERRQLVSTFENMVRQMADLEQHISALQLTLQKSDDAVLVDEGMEIVKNSGDIAQCLASKLSEVKKKLARRSRADSSASGSSSGSSRRSSAEISEIVPVKEATHVQKSCSTAASPPKSTRPPHSPSLKDRDKPIPRPRSVKTLSRPPLEAPIQETTKGGMSPLLLHPARGSRAEYIHRKRTPPPVAPKKPGLTTSRSVQCHLPSMSSTTRSQKEATTDYDDLTGDSGMGTGSGSGLYDAVEDWRQAIIHPPPEKQKTEHLYTPIREELADDDQEYQLLERSM